MGVVFGLDYYGVFKVNLDKKLELAHEWAMEFIGNPTTPLKDMKSIVLASWQYADAMEAEYNKRKQAESEQNAKQSKILFEQLTKNKDGSCAHFHTTLNKAECFDCGSRLNDDFQVDWSVAPDWANYWYMTAKKNPKWCNRKPYTDGCDWFVGANETYTLSDAPSFNYQGDWKDSLRKRP